MKRVFSVFVIFILLLTFLIPITAYADSIGDGNVDGGGGGIGSGTSTDYWNNGDEGVRVTVIRISDHAVVTILFPPFGLALCVLMKRSLSLRKLPLTIMSTGSIPRSSHR